MFESLTFSEQKYYKKLSRMAGNILKGKSSIKKEINRVSNPKGYHNTLHSVILNYPALTELVKKTKFIHNERLGALLAYDIINGKLKFKEIKFQLLNALGDEKLKKIERHVYLRFNTLKKNNLDLKGYDFEETCVPDVYYCQVFEEKLKSKNDRLSFKLNLLEDNSIMKNFKIQNLSSCFPAFILNPPEDSIVIDAASSPGNKTTHLCSIMNNTGRIYAFEKCFERYKILCNQLELYGATNTVPICKDFLDVETQDYPAEYILLDPSCSGSGIHINYIKDQDRVNALHNFQVMMLNKALNFRPKKVVYSVCSTHHEEGEDVIKEVLNSNEDYEVENISDFWNFRGIKGYDFSEKVIRVYENEKGIDGFFVALLSKKLNY